MWRAHVEKFSPEWFVAVHATIPFIAMLRKACLMPKWAVIFTVASAVIGQARAAPHRRRPFYAHCPPPPPSNASCPLPPLHKHCPCARLWLIPRGGGGGGEVTKRCQAAEERIIMYACLVVYTVVTVREQESRCARRHG